MCFKLFDRCFTLVLLLYTLYFASFPASCKSLFLPFLIIWVILYEMTLAWCCWLHIFLYIKSVFKGFLHQAHSVCSQKYIKEEIQILVGMFDENGHKVTFLEALDKNYNAKKRNNDSRNYTNSKKIPWT